jgi:CheY-like chemotaxis protein
MADLKMRILYVEDNPDDQLILERSLKQKMPIDYDLIAVDTATKGLNKIKKETFDLLLLDYRLPDMTGIELIQELKKKQVKTPIILLTSKGSENIAVEAMKLGIRDYIVKEDIGSQRLVDSVKETLLKSALPETVDLETAKSIATLFDKSPTLQIESTCTLRSKPKSEIHTEKLFPTLKNLAEINIVEAEPSRSVVACPDCGTLTTAFYLECPECESTQINKEEALEHFDCGNIDFRSKFDKGEGVLVCPKCGKKLKVIGVDYRKIENWYSCPNKHFFGQPNIKFGCPKCNRRFSLEEAKLEMLQRYKLTKSGRQMLKLGIKATELTEKSQQTKSSKKT